jgi:hypothetical protein
MDIKELKAALVSKGWNEDSYGHHKRTFLVDRGHGEQPHEHVYRVKVQKLSVRLERQYEVAASEYSPAKKEWFKVDGAYLKDIRVREDGGIIIGRKVIK